MVFFIWSFLVWLGSLQFLIQLNGNKRHWALLHMLCRGSFPSPPRSARQPRSSQQWRSRQFAWNSLTYWVCKYRRHCGRAVSQTPGVISFCRMDTPLTNRLPKINPKTIKTMQNMWKPWIAENSNLSCEWRVLGQIQQSSGLKVVSCNTISQELIPEKLPMSNLNHELK